MKGELLKYLSVCELAELLDFSHKSLLCRNFQNLEKIIMGLKKFFCFEAAHCAYGNISDLFSGNLETSNVGLFNISYPDEYLNIYLSNKCYNTDAVLLEFATNLSPVNWGKIDRSYNANYPAATFAYDFKLYDGWTHGTLDISDMNCYILFFGGPVRDGSRRTEKILEYITPFYAEAYKKVISNSGSTKHNLTKREIEVLQWIKEGKSSWEISVILKRSKRTIDFHISNIKKKLNVVSRAQAVATALHQRIIPF